MKNPKSSRRGVYQRSLKIALGIGVLFFLPYLILLDDSYIRIHDTLEGEWIWYHILLENGVALSLSPDTMVEQVMNGLPRVAFLSGFTVMPLLMNLFGVFWGYLINKLIIFIIAFSGMFLLLNRYILTETSHKYIIPLVSILFSCIPYFTTFGISVAGQPILLFAFLNILNSKSSWTDFLIILLFPFYSSLVWSGPAVLLGVSAIWIHSYLKTKQINPKYIIAIVMLLAGFILVNIQLLQLFNVPGDFVSHRNSYNFFYDKPLTLGFSIKETIQTFFITHYHVGNFITVPIFLSLFWVISERKMDKLMKYILFLIISICFFYGFYNWIVLLTGNLLPIVKSFKFDRFIILLPLLWTIIFALILARLNGARVWRRAVVYIFIAQLAIVLLAQDELHHNIRQLTGTVKKPNFKSFFSENLYEQIDKYIGKEKSTYWVVSLGINPSIAQYNGFYTLDGIQAIYDSTYKANFRKIMAAELEKDPELKEYFDAWGNRCYLYSAELGKEDQAFMNSAAEDRRINEFEVNVKSLQELGGEFIFAGVKIENAERTGLELIQTFEDEESFWKIYLYKIKRD